MDVKDIKELFTGIAVIIDNEIDIKSSSIYKIKEEIESSNIPVATYSDIPEQEVISSLSNASFIILDWDFINQLSIEQNQQEEVSQLIIGSTLKKIKKDKLINFIKELNIRVFVPVFIFTGFSTEEIQNELIQEEVIIQNKPSKIFVKQKNEVDDSTKLFTSINEWLKSMPSAYVIKEWEKVFINAKNDRFIQMYSNSSNWTNIVWNLIKEDCIDNQNEFGDFITRYLINGINEYSFCDEYFTLDNCTSNTELRSVIQGERYVKYINKPEQVYTGDLFKKDKHYYLNIRAQCDLSRKDENGNYNPKLYCIKGKKMCRKDILTDDIRLTSESKLVFYDNKFFNLNDLCDICKDENRLSKFNNIFKQHRNKVFYHRGEIIEKKPNAIISCIADELAILFDLNDIQLFEYSELKDNRIGRILPPYINKIQQKCVQYFTREGVMPVPREVFFNFD